MADGDGRVSADRASTVETPPERRDAPVDPRAIRVSVAPTSRLPSDPTITVGPPSIAVEPLRDQLAGVGILGGVPAVPPASDPLPGPPVSPLPVVDGSPVPARLDWLDESRAILVRGEGAGETRTRVLLGPVRQRDGTSVREVVVDGWRIDLELESERRAALRERSRRGIEAGGRTGPLEVHAIIPGRIVAVSVEKGEQVTAGQVLLVLEAMKMQNELRAPREGTIERIAVAVGVNVEVGDLLMVIS
jgi:biotin carboxyl carrier protein